MALDSRRNQILLGGVIVIILIVAIGTFFTYRTVKANADKVSDTLGRTTSELTDLNERLSTLNNLSLSIKQVQDDVGKLNESMGELTANYKQLTQINQNIQNISSSINILQEKYPPSQVVNLQNVKQEQLNQAIAASIETELNQIKNKINAIQFNFYWTLFNSLFSISILSLAFILYKKSK